MAGEKNCNTFKVHNLRKNIDSDEFFIRGRKGYYCNMNHCTCNMIYTFLVVVKAQSTAVDKVQHRLEQLDYFEEGSQTKFDLSQTEYVSRIDQLNKELVAAWNSEQRVKSLKIAIQCAKLLADTRVLRFYPSKFVLITDILDVFGQLVYNRLRKKAYSSKYFKI